jgi:hypothetical protein
LKELLITQNKIVITKDSKVVASKNQVNSELDGEAVILHLQSGIYYGLNQVGAEIWNLLREPKNVSQVISAIKETYFVDADRCERDLMSLLQRLSEEGLIEVIGEADN